MSKYEMVIENGHVAIRLEGRIIVDWTDLTVTSLKELDNLVALANRPLSEEDKIAMEKRNQ